MNSKEENSPDFSLDFFRRRIRPLMSADQWGRVSFPLLQKNYLLGVFGKILLSLSQPEDNTVSAE